MLQCHHFIFRISSFLTQEILAKKWENIIDLQYFSREKKQREKCALMPDISGIYEKEFFQEAVAGQTEGDPEVIQCILL